MFKSADELKQGHQAGDVWLGSDPVHKQPCMFSMTWDSILIAWTFCGECNKHLTNCLHNLPIEPKWLQRERIPPSERPSFETAVSGPKRSEISNKILGSPSESGRSISISDFVDDSLVAKVKKAKEDRDATGQ